MFGVSKFRGAGVRYFIFVRVVWGRRGFVEGYINVVVGFVLKGFFNKIENGWGRV